MVGSTYFLSYKRGGPAPAMPGEELKRRYGSSKTSVHGPWTQPHEALPSSLGVRPFNSMDITSGLPVGHKAAKAESERHQVIMKKMLRWKK